MKKGVYWGILCCHWICASGCQSKHDEKILVADAYSEMRNLSGILLVSTTRDDQLWQQTEKTRNRYAAEYLQQSVRKHPELFTLESIARLETDLSDRWGTRYDVTVTEKSDRALVIKIRSAGIDRRFEALDEEGDDLQVMTSAIPDFPAANDNSDGKQDGR